MKDESLRKPWMVRTPEPPTDAGLTDHVSVSGSALEVAFAAWHAAVEEQAQMMRLVTSGTPVDAVTMSQKMGEVDTLYGLWVDLLAGRTVGPRDD